MTFTYQRTVRFQDTDAAGVVYFANVLAMCHEAYEESLIAVGIDLKSFFTNSNVAIPIVHASVDFLRPIFCGDTLVIHLILKQVSPDTFEIAYQITKTDQLVAKAVTKHVCIDPTNRIRQKLPGNMIQWFNGIELQEE